MQWTIQRDDLLTGLEMLKGSVDSRSGIPVMHNVLCETDATTSQLLITANNLGHGMKRALPATITQPGAVTIPALKLFELCRNLASAPMTFTVAEDAWVTLRCAGFTSRLAGLPKRDFPDFATTADAEQVCVVPAADLVYLITNTSFAVSHDESRQTLNGVELRVTPTALTMTATDGHRLATATVTCQTPHDVTATLLIGTSALIEIKKLCQNADEPVTLHIFPHPLIVTAATLIVTAATTTFAVRLTEGTFPAWEAILPTDSPIQVLLTTDDIRAVIRRVALMCNDARVLKCELTTNCCHLSAVNPNLGEASEQLDIEYSGADMAVGINASYLLDSLTALATDALWLHVSTPMEPLVVHPATLPAGHTVTHVIMPMRL